VSDLDNGTLLLSVKTFTGRPPAIRHIRVKREVYVCYPWCSSEQV